ncbi:MAG: 23S rRNA (guanosine2251-2'-O)-methyltransferase [Candidatus Tokpelaia sp. JSC188]|nr:MAG: 23S rRNA (guanosine2251-2'-O)-methyltransferase [Candidatus Tokpelaia sp. JSC188]
MKTPKDFHSHLQREHHPSKGRHHPSKGRNISKIYTKGTIVPNLPKGHIWLYGLHTIEAALKNPRRKIHRLLITSNAYSRLGFNESQFPCRYELTESRILDRYLGSEIVHQGIMLETEPLIVGDLKNLPDLPLIVILDQITDPHNVGAIMRSAVAFNASAVITTTKHSPRESSVLAKVAAGALELINYIVVRNLARAIETLHEMGFQTFGLDSRGLQPLEASFSGEKIALILGAEGKGLRQKTRKMVSTLARLDMPGEIKSLNVSNAAAIAFYVAHSYLSHSKQRY